MLSSFNKRDLNRAPPAPPRIRILFWTIGILIALAQCARYSQWVNRDSISYLDMSDGVAAGDLSRFVNATWSPLYPFLLGVANVIIHPSISMEFSVAHGVNFICFLLAFGAFEFLVASLPPRPPSLQHPSDRKEPHWALAVVQYSIFLWAALGLVSLMKLAPDLLMSVFVFLAAGLLLRIRNGYNGLPMYALLGLMLGVGYLAKALMFPLGMLIMALAMCSPAPFRKKLRGVFVAVFCFAIIAAPLVFSISHRVHHLSFSEVSTVVHFVNIEHVAPYFQSTGGAHGAYVHRITALVTDKPQVLSFSRPINATYALWFDPYYWTEGVRPAHYMSRQIYMVLASCRILAGIGLQLAGVFLVLAYMAFRAGLRATVKSLREVWPWYAISLAATSAYAVSLVETRYVSAFFLLTGIALIFSVWHPLRFSRRTLEACALIITINLGISLLIEMQQNDYQQAAKMHLGDANAAIALHNFGIAPGTSVASIEPLIASGWARLAKVRIVAEVPRGQAREYWTSTPEHQAAIMAAFESVGCKAVVAWIGKQPVSSGWLRLGDSEYAVHRLS